MFRGCGSLQSVPLFDTGAVEDMSFMFSGCFSLQSVPALVVSSVTSFTDMFAACVSLGSAPLSGAVNDISFASAKLSRDELVAIFSALGTAAKTITIKSNWGVPSLTADDKKIATDKGWTIVEA